MNAFERFERSAAAARSEPAPALDVVGRVMAELTRTPGPTPRRNEGSLALVVWAVASVLAASVVAAVALEAWSTMLDPMGALIESYIGVMQ